jgi:hypothetical protein
MRTNTEIVAATRRRASAEVGIENIAASQSRVDHADVAAAMTGFACELLRRRAQRRAHARTDAPGRPILRLLG